MISFGGNAYSVPDTARRRVLDVQCLIDEAQIFEDGVMIARHALLPGRGQSCIDPTHRKPLQRSRIIIDHTAVLVRGAGPAFGWRPCVSLVFSKLNETLGTPSVSECEGDVVARRSLEFYDALGRVMAVKGNA